MSYGSFLTFIKEYDVNGHPSIHEAPSIVAWRRLMIKLNTQRHMAALLPLIKDSEVF